MAAPEWAPWIVSSSSTACSPARGTAAKLSVSPKSSTRRRSDLRLRPVPPPGAGQPARVRDRFVDRSRALPGQVLGDRATRRAAHLLAVLPWRGLDGNLSPLRVGRATRAPRSWTVTGARRENGSPDRPKSAPKSRSHRNGRGSVDGHAAHFCIVAEGELSHRLPLWRVTDGKKKPGSAMSAEPGSAAERLVGLASERRSWNV